MKNQAKSGTVIKGLRKYTIYSYILFLRRPAALNKHNKKAGK